MDWERGPSSGVKTPSPSAKPWGSQGLAGSLYLSLSSDSVSDLSGPSAKPLGSGSTRVGGAKARVHGGGAPAAPFDAVAVTQSSALEARPLQLNLVPVQGPASLSAADTQEGRRSDFQFPD